MVAAGPSGPDLVRSDGRQATHILQQVLEHVGTFGDQAEACRRSRLRSPPRSRRASSAQTPAPGRARAQWPPTSAVQVARAHPRFRRPARPVCRRPTIPRSAPQLPPRRIFAHLGWRPRPSRRAEWLSAGIGGANRLSTTGMYKPNPQITHDYADYAHCGALTR